MDNKIFTYEFLLVNSPPTVKDYVIRSEKIPQSYDWHPESFVGIHTRIVLNRARLFKNNDLVLAAYFHDLGKVDVTKSNGKGGFSAHDHEKISAKLVWYNKSWIRSLKCNAEKVKWIVENHMRVKYLDEMKPKKQSELLYHQWSDELFEFYTCDSREGLSIMEVSKAGGNIFLFLYNKIKTFLKNKI